MERIKTYLTEFDDLVHKGIPAGSVVLVAGTSGVMKSSFMYTVLYNNAINGKNSIYLSLEQDKASLTMQMSGFGMDPKNAEGALYVLDRYEIQKGIEAIQRRTFLEVFLEYLMDLKTQHRFELLGLDSLSVLEIIAKMKKPRFELFRFFEALRELNLTSFLISEMSPDSNKYGKYDEDFLSDGIINLMMAKVSDTRVQRRIRIVKMRSTKHSTDWYALMFENGKFTITKAISAIS